ncbi:hypothetical protein Vi05172_g6224 [Venturia inaequalis]|nr:hypothetical protein Vi05172_g6224 [Venturia inaequalis]
MRLTDAPQAMHSVDSQKITTDQVPTLTQMASIGTAIRLHFNGFLDGIGRSGSSGCIFTARLKGVDRSTDHMAQVNTIFFFGTMVRGKASGIFRQTAKLVVPLARRRNGPP